MNRSRIWITNAGCAFIAAACSTAPNNTPGNPTAGSGSSASGSGGGSVTGTGGSVTGTGGSVTGTGGSNTSAGAPGESMGGAPVSGAGAAGMTSASAGATGASAGAATGGAASGGSTGMAGSSGVAGAPAVTNALVTSASGAYWKTATWTEGTGTANVTVNAANTFQTWDGFGGAFNEMGWNFLSTKALQDQAIQMLFGVEGCHFAWGRIPMGASDYAMDRYTLNENAGDNEMTKFSIERDKQKLIPYIKAAQAIRPDLRFWASPWTPPSWMKSSPYQTPGNPVNAFDGGTMKSDEATMKAHALYFVKFIKAYSEQNIKVEYVAPQNEPNYSQNYPSAIWSPSTFTSFIGKYLGPALASANPTAQIMLGTMSNPNADPAVANAVLADSTAKGFCKVMGVQWGMSDSGQVSNLQSRGAGIPIWLSEHKCGGNPGANVAAAPNDLSYAEESWGWIRDAIKRGLTAYNTWNMVLDKGGKGIDNTRVWAQNALLVVDGGKIVQTPVYHVFRHLSQYVEPQAKRIDATGGDAVAFKNPDGSLVVIMRNEGAANNNYAVSIGGKTLQFAMPASGWATIRYKP